VSRVEKKNVNETLKVQRGVSTDVQLQQLENFMRIPYFRGIFMRITLPIEEVRQNESGIVPEGGPVHIRLDAVREKNRVMYLDSFW